MNTEFAYPDVTGVILAAGKGTRMHSTGPKVMQEILGKPMLWYVLQVAQRVCTSVFPVVGYKREELSQTFPEWTEAFVVQHEQKGTGHALVQAMKHPEVNESGYLLVLNGDAPLVPVHVLQDFVRDSRENRLELGILSMEPEDPGNYGRIVRDHSGTVDRIVEAKDIESAEVSELKEVNAGIYLIQSSVAHKLLTCLDTSNQQNELYLTQAVEIGREQGISIGAFNCGNQPALLGINTVSELVQQEEHLRQSIVRDWIEEGVIIRTPHSVRIGPEVKIEAGAQITGPCEILGRSFVSASSRVAGNTFLKDCEVQGAQIEPFSHLEKATLQEGARIGPFARLRPDTDVGEGSRVGNFVEIKKSTLNPGSKANHLSYIGDTDVGEKSNIGAGTITCNYDGKSKHRTRIGKEAFIGSNTALVAPVSVGDRALVGAGSTITKDVPEDSLAVAREKQRNMARKK